MKSPGLQVQGLRRRVADAAPRRPCARRPATITRRRDGNSLRVVAEDEERVAALDAASRRGRCAPSRATPGVGGDPLLERLRAAASASGRRRRAGRAPKSARPTWIRSPAVLLTPAAIESSATISPTPMRDAGRGQRGPARTPQQVLPDEADPGHGASSSLVRRLVRSVRMAVSRDAVLKALEQVIDPELRRNRSTELDMVRDVEIDGGDVAVTIALTVAGCPLRASFQDQVAERARRRSTASSACGSSFDVMTPEERVGADGEAARRRRRARRRGSRSTARRACSRSPAARAASASRR